MNEFDRNWNRLVALARSAPVADDVIAAPAGFATRVAAVWLSSQRSSFSNWLFEPLLVRGLGVACLVMILWIAVVWPAVSLDASYELVELADPLPAEALPQ